MVHHTISPCELWHRRLGHLHHKALPRLQHMVKGMPIFYFEHDSVCQGCALGMNVKKSLFRSHTKSKGILYLLHSYVCGTMSSPSLSGYLYYVFCIDYFSRKLWIYFLKVKSETFSKV